MSDLIDNGGYRFWEDDFSLQSAYEDCKVVFDGITDDDSFQECDTGLILYHAYEIMYALKKALLVTQPEVIRCKDCKHHRYERGKIPYCNRIDYGYGWKDDDFCSRAERKEAEI